uniref:Uncharacterized protein n=1 Tax=Gorilla gorilla gorilla TaxID=9595 RepID=A0A2I2Z2Q3_GORGO
MRWTGWGPTPQVTRTAGVNPDGPQVHQWPRWLETSCFVSSVCKIQEPRLSLRTTWPWPWRGMGRVCDHPGGYLRPLLLPGDKGAKSHAAPMQPHVPDDGSQASPSHGCSWAASLVAWTSHPRGTCSRQPPRLRRHGRRWGSSAGDGVTDEDQPQPRGPLTAGNRSTPPVGAEP